MKIDIVRVISYVICLFMMFPLIIALFSSFTSEPLITFPPAGFSLKWYSEALSDPTVISTMLNSFIIAFITSAFSLFVGIAAAEAITRRDFFGRDLLSAFFQAPIMLPMIVLALALLMFFTDMGVTNTLTGLVLGHIVITFPYVVRLVSAGLIGVDKSLEKSAQILGANEIQTFFSITFPLIRSAVMAGFLFAFVTSFNNVSISLFLIMSPGLQTLPLTIFNYTYVYITPLIPAISTIAVLINVSIVFALERVFGVYALMAKMKNTT